ncbi:MAG: hypothetical protein PVI26_11450 [Chitinispirillia bacterium]|jgi:hypothetical protein
MRYFLILFILFFSTTIINADLIEIITFDEPYTGMGPYYEDGMIIERIPGNIPLFLSPSSSTLDFSEYNGPVTFDGSSVVFRTEGINFDLLSLDIVSTYSDANFGIFANEQSLRFQAFGPPEGIIRPAIGTHSLAEYSFLSNISTFTIRGSGLSCILDNITFQTSSVPEPSVLNLTIICALLFGCFIKKKIL